MPFLIYLCLPLSRVHLPIARKKKSLFIHLTRPRISQIRKLLFLLLATHTIIRFVLLERRSHRLRLISSWHHCATTSRSLLPVIHLSFLCILVPFSHCHICALPPLASLCTFFFLASLCLSLTFLYETPELFLK